MIKQDSQKFRHELKYLISAGEMTLIKNRVNHLISLDSHVGHSGVYSIRSLYFDDYYNRCFYENEKGYYLGVGHCGRCRRRCRRCCCADALQKVQ